MRMLALPAALLLGVALYTLVPGAKTWISQRLSALPGIIRQNIIERRKNPDDKAILFLYLSGPVLFSTLLSLVHPVADALVMAPLFSFFALMPECFSAKRELDSGKYAKDREAYETRVVHCCEALGEALVPCLITPLILCAIGLPLHLGGALGWTYAALRLLEIKSPRLIRILALPDRMGNAVAMFLLHLCAGLFGRNPLRIGGEDAKETLMHLLGLQGEADHAPIAGDISQSAFACCLCAFLLCLLLTLAGMLLV
ncbi:MAG: hypothetical protein IKU34_06035 [Clostridia bacterium]|nr:hypothetical protein [Clostridia bacterium]